jgi:hypothetical protein
MQAAMIQELAHATFVCGTSSSAASSSYQKDVAYCRSWISEELCAGQVWCAECTAQLCGHNKGCIEAKGLEEGLKKQRRIAHSCTWQEQTGAPTAGEGAHSATLILLILCATLTLWRSLCHS